MMLQHAKLFDVWVVWRGGINGRKGEGSTGAVAARCEEIEKNHAIRHPSPFASLVCSLGDGRPFWRFVSTHSAVAAKQSRQVSLSHGFQTRFDAGGSILRSSPSFFAAAHSSDSAASDAMNTL